MAILSVIKHLYICCSTTGCYNAETLQIMQPSCERLTLQL